MSLTGIGIGGGGTGGGAGWRAPRATELSSTTPNGSRRDFAFANTIVDLDWIAIDGQVQAPADYSFATNTVTFVAGVPAPDTTAKIVAGYFY